MKAQIISLLSFALCGISATAQTGPGTALSFDGVNGQMRVPGISNAPTTEVTIEFWQKVSAVRVQSTFSRHNFLPEVNFDAFVPYGDGKVYWQFGNAGNGGDLSYTPPESLVGSWQHFALVASQSGNFMRIYRNGVLEAQKIGMTPYPGGNLDLDIGKAPYGGLIDEFRIWNVARSQAQIQTGMNPGLATPQPGLVGYWRFDEGTGTNVSDSSGFGHLGYLVNGSLWVASTLPSVPASITQPASIITPTSATLNGTVNPNGSATAAWFQWGSTVAYGSATLLTNIGSGTDPVLVRASVGGLSPGATYHYRLAASNSFGLVTALDQSFQAALQNVNVWVNPLSELWETAQNWSAGLPSSAQSALFITNANSKTVTFDFNTVNHFPTTTVISNLTVGAPFNPGVNDLSLLNAGLNRPLRVLNEFFLEGGGRLSVAASLFQVDGYNTVKLDGQTVLNNGWLSASNASVVIVGNTHAGSLTVSNNSFFSTPILRVGDLLSGNATFVNSTGMLKRLLLAQGSGQTGTVSIIGGEFIATNSASLSGSIIGDRGYGQMTVSNAFVSLDRTSIGNFSRGSLTVQSGTLTPGNTSLGLNTNLSGINGDGFLVVNGGRVSMPELHVGVLAAGTVTVAGGSLSNAVVSVAENPGASGTLNILGGIHLISSFLSVGSSNAFGQISINGGVLAIANVRESGLLDIDNGTCTIDGGSLSIDNLSISGASSHLIVNGGTTTIKKSTVSNGLPFVVGNGVSTAQLNLSEGTHTFADGLNISPNGVVTAGCATINGPITNNGTFVANCPGGLLAIKRLVVNNGTILASNGCIIAFDGSVVNYGSISGTTGSDFRFLGGIVNDGTIVVPPSANYALVGVATQSSTIYHGAARNALDGNTDANFANGSVAQTAGGENPAWWQVDLGAMKSIGRLSVWFRADCCPDNANNFRLIVKDAGTNVVWQHQYTGRPPANVAFNLSPAIQGQVLRVESSGNPGGVLSLAEVQVIPPVQANSIIITQDNRPHIIAEVNHTATVGPVLAVVGESLKDELSFQWQLNGVDISGATAQSYTTPILAFADSGNQYTCTLSLPGLSVTSAVAMLTVVADQTSPQLYSVTFNGVGTSDSSSIPTLNATLLFSEYMDSADLTNLINYSFVGGTVIGAVAGSDHQSVTLAIAGIAPPLSDYSLTVRSVRDISSNSFTTITNFGIIPAYAINHALAGMASQSSTGLAADARRAIDGNTDGDFGHNSVTQNASPENPGWWEVDLGVTKAIGRIHLWFRTDCCNGQPGVSGPARDDNFTLKILNASRAVIWANTYPGTPPTDLFFNFTSALQARYVRFESQSPLTTSDGMFSLAEVQVFAPFTNAVIHEVIDLTSVNYLSFTNTVEENHTVTFGPVSAFVDGPAEEKLTYQWQNNGVDIPGATHSTYTTPLLTLGNNGSIYQCRFVLPGFDATNQGWRLSVIPDHTPPHVVSIAFDERGSGTPVKAIVNFDEVMSSSNLLNPASYQFLGGSIVSNITMNSDSKSIAFYFYPAFGSNGQYSLTVGGVADLKGNPLGPVPTFSGNLPFSTTNLALGGIASQSSIGSGGSPQRAIDGNTDGNFGHESSTQNNPPEQGGWWEENLGSEKYIGRIHLWFRTDCCSNRQDNFTLKVLDARRQPVWQRQYLGHPGADAGFNIAPAIAGQYVRFEAPVPQIDQGEFSLAEVQIFAPFVTNLARSLTPKLAISLSGSNFVLSWRGTGALQSAQSVNGPWTTVTNASSPYLIDLDKIFSRFWRIPTCFVCLFKETALVTIDPPYPSEAWPEETVSVHYSLYNENNVAVSGFVNGYVTRDYTARIVRSDFDSQPYSIPPFGQTSGILDLKNWEPQLLFPRILYPGTGFNPTYQGPPGSFDIVLETWEPNPRHLNSTVTYQGTLYGTGSEDDRQIDLYPNCFRENPTFGQLLAVDLNVFNSRSHAEFSLRPTSNQNLEQTGQTGDLYVLLDPNGQRVAMNEVVQIQYSAWSGDTLSYKTHPGGISSITISAPGIAGTRVLPTKGGLDVTGQAFLVDLSGLPASAMSQPVTLTVMGNCGLRTLSLTLPTKIQDSSTSTIPPTCTSGMFTGGAQAVQDPPFQFIASYGTFYQYDFVNISSAFVDTITNPNSYPIWLVNSASRGIVLQPNQSITGKDMQMFYGATSPSLPMTFYIVVPPSSYGVNGAPNFTYITFKYRYNCH